MAIETAVRASRQFFSSSIPSSDPRLPYVVGIANAVRALVTTLPTLTVRFIVLAMCLMPVACQRPSDNERSAAFFRNPNASEEDVHCVADPAASDPIPFSRVELGGDDLQRIIREGQLSGPRTQTVVLDSLAWPRVWRAAFDSAAPPAVTFRNDALVLAVTRTYTNGPNRLTIEAIRQCRRTRGVVVATLETWPHGGVQDSGSRGLAVVRVPRHVLEGARVTFIATSPQ